MKVYIQTDIEGVAGFVFFDNLKNATHEGFAHRQRMRKLLTGEVNAAARAAFDGGAETVLINDSHGSGYNILFEELDPRCEIIHGRNCSGPDWLSDLDDSMAALVQVGMHAMAGTPNACLCHTKWVVNEGEYYLSEASMAAALAGDLGVPAVFVSGDNYLVQEVREKIPGIETAVVKKALGTYVARSRCPQAARDLIYRGVAAGLKKRRKIKPFRIPGPVTLNLLESKQGNHDQREGLEFTHEKTTAESITAAFRQHLRQYAWFPGQVSLPDGFAYPPA